MLVPDMDGVQLVQTTLTAKDLEPADLLSGPHDLLRIETVTRLPDGQEIAGTLWCDRTGDVLKSYSAALGMEIYRATKAAALEKADSGEFDLIRSMMIKVAQPLADAHQTKQVRYRVHLEGGDPAAAFVTGPTQAVKSIGPHTAEVTVYAIRPGGKGDRPQKQKGPVPFSTGQPGGNPAAPADPPTDDDLRPNNFIQSDDPLIIADAKKVVGDEKDPWRVAVALERFVSREMTNPGYRQAFATASEAARNHEGDCKAHAVLLAALCRARAVPARVAIGLVYVEERQAFMYHMWTEVYVEGRWAPLDATRANGGIGAAHLKLGQSNLKTASALSALLPIMRVAGRLKIEIVAAQ